MSAPLLGVVTPTLNSARHFGAALASLSAVGLGRVRHIVVDGGSTDETLAIAAGAPGVILLERPGTGIYDALNAGLAALDADAVLFLNSDDLVDARALRAAVERLGADARLDAVAAAAEVFEEDEGGARRALRRLEPPTDGPRDRALLALIDRAPLLNAHVFRRGFVDRLGPFATGYRVAADRDFMFRAVLAAPSLERLDAVLYRYRRHTGSSTFHLDRRKRVGIAAEHRRMAAEWLAGGALPAFALPAFRRWEAEEAGMEVLLRLGGGEVGAAIAAGLGQWRHDLLWPARATAALTLRLARAVGRRVGLGRD